jgi:hypothetical protein
MVAVGTWECAKGFRHTSEDVGWPDGRKYRVCGRMSYNYLKCGGTTIRTLSWIGTLEDTRNVVIEGAGCRSSRVGRGAAVRAAQTDLMD